jgi:carbon-monoxide dehydrogenase large subunit
VVVDPEQALAAGAPILHAGFGTNQCFAAEFGSPAADAQRALSAAAHTVRLRLRHNRLAAAAIEPRGILASWDQQAGRLHVWLSTQRPNANREELAAIFSLQPEQVRVICHDVGGAFGSKSMIYREHVLAAYLSIKHGRPVRWIATRSEDFQACSSGRGLITDVQAGFDRDGRLLVLDVRITGTMGAYLHGNTTLTPIRVARILAGAYRVERVHTEVRGAFTNTPPTGPYRGAGRPEAAYIVERVMDLAARDLGLDPLDIRRRNFIRPNQFPWKTPTGATYDSGDYERTLDDALRQAGYADLLRRREDARARGDLFGIGFSTFVEPSAGGFETGRVRVESDGRVVAATGSSSHGQGHVTTFAQVLADRLQVPIERITVLENDTDLGVGGIGTMGSRSTVLGGGALARAADGVLDKMKRLVAHALEADAADVVLEAGRFHVAGAPARGLTFEEVAARAYQPERLPPDIEPGLEASDRFQTELEAWGHGTHIAAVSIDRETGKVRLEKLVAVDDAGVIVNPLLAHGQIAGGLAQAAAQALWEELEFDENGVNLTGTLMDYEMPGARELPMFVLGETQTPSPLNPLGVKGLGEAGAVGLPPAIVNAVMDALQPLGVSHLDMPLTPEKVWRALS